ncbi:TPA: hypothetical protein ACTZ3H_005406 [Bacillus cereus]|uniref:hypothetical protein n=1 Tax=Bacillus thuringiensis TaxID=1428 RepID=UPI0005A32490|nr:hypothetical protein [Bacillus thuringiensis]AJH80260.1 hypothetical protein BF36_5452 [Bacillus thuringiensis]QKI16110.1 hypothetical protein FOC88_00205 [Bacillus thuringiensis]QKI21329.1 hypothetical protein FOC88_27575 [Bacillus thuringiensis]
MIFRHYTPIEKLPSILSDGYLKGREKQNVSDYGCVSLEEYKGNDVLLKCFVNQDAYNKKNLIPLFFDGDKMEQDSLKFKNIDYSKAENYIFVLNGTITQEEYEQIGEYYFHIGNLSLDYLTEETKEIIGY